LLEVNNYFISGLLASSIDKWFSGPVPQFQPADLGVPNQGKRSLADQLERAHIFATDASQMAWQTVRLLVKRHGNLIEVLTDFIGHGP